MTLLCILSLLSRQALKIEMVEYNSTLNRIFNNIMCKWGHRKDTILATDKYEGGQNAERERERE